MGDRIDNLTLDGKRLIKELKVLELKTELERRGLSKYGNKKELLQRLSIFEENRQKSLSGQPSREAPNQWLENEADLNNDFLREYFRSQKALFQEHAQRRTEIGVGEAPNVALRKEQLQSNDEFALSTSHRESFSPTKIAPTSPSKKKKKKKKTTSDDEQVTYTPSLYESSLATSRPSRSSAQTSRALNVVSFDDEDSESAEIDPYVFDIKEKKKAHKKHHRIPTLKLHSPSVDSVSQQKSLRILSSYSGEERVPSLKIKLPEPVPKISTSIISPTKDSVNRKEERELSKTSSVFKKTSTVCLSPQNAEVSSSVEEIVTNSLVKSVPESCADSTSNEGNSSSDTEKRISSVEENSATPEVIGSDSSNTSQKLNLKISSRKQCLLGNQQWFRENTIQKESPLLNPLARNVNTSVAARKETESNIDNGDLKTLPTSHFQSVGVKPTVRKRGRPRLNPIPTTIPLSQIQSVSSKPCAVTESPCKEADKIETIVSSESIKPCTSAVSTCKEISKNFKPCISAVTTSNQVAKIEQVVQIESIKPSTRPLSPCKVVSKNEQVLQSGSFKPCVSAVSPCKVIPKTEQIAKKLEDQRLSCSQLSIEKNQIKEDLINLRLKELDIKESKLKQLSVSFQTKMPTVSSNSSGTIKKVDESIRRSSRLYKPLPAETVKKKNEFSAGLMKTSKSISTFKQSSNKLYPEKTTTETLRMPASCERPDYFESLKQQIEMPLYVEKFPSDKSEVTSSTSELSDAIKTIPKIAGVPCNYQSFTHDTPILDAHMVVEGHTSHASTVIPGDRSINSSLVVSSLPLNPNLENSCSSTVKKSGYLIENLIDKAKEGESKMESIKAVANTSEISRPNVDNKTIKETLLPLIEKSSFGSEKVKAAKCKIVLLPFESDDDKYRVLESKEEASIGKTGKISEANLVKQKPEHSHSNDPVKKTYQAISALQNADSAVQQKDQTEELNLFSDNCTAVQGTLTETKLSGDFDCQNQMSAPNDDNKLPVSAMEELAQQKIISDYSTSTLIRKLSEPSLPSTSLIDLKGHKQTHGKIEKQNKGSELFFETSGTFENKDVLKDNEKPILLSKTNIGVCNNDLSSNFISSISGVNVDTKEIKIEEKTDVLLQDSYRIPTLASPKIESGAEVTKVESEIMSFKDILMEAALAADIDSDDLAESLCSVSAETVLTIPKGSNLRLGSHNVSGLNRRSSLDTPENILKGNLEVKFPAATSIESGRKPHSKKHDFIEKLSANVYNVKKDSSKGLMEIIFDLDKRAKQISDVEVQEQSLDLVDNKAQTQPIESLNSADIGRDNCLENSSDKVEHGAKEEIHTETHVSMDTLLCKDSSESLSQSLISSPVALDSPLETTSVSEEEVNFFREVMESVPELEHKKPCFDPPINIQVAHDSSNELSSYKTKEVFINVPKSVAPLDMPISDSPLNVSSKINVSPRIMGEGPNEKDKPDCTLLSCQLKSPSYSVKKLIALDESKLSTSEDLVNKSQSETTEINKHIMKLEPVIETNISGFEKFSSSSGTVCKIKVEDSPKKLVSKTEVDMSISKSILKLTNTSGINSHSLKQAIPLIDKGTHTTGESEIISQKASLESFATESTLKQDLEPVASSENPSACNKIEDSAESKTSFPIMKDKNYPWEKDVANNDVSAIEVDNILLLDKNNTLCHKEHPENCLTTDSSDSLKMASKIQLNQNSSNIGTQATHLGEKPEVCSTEELNSGYSLETQPKVTAELLCQSETSSGVSLSKEPNKKVNFKEPLEKPQLLSDMDIFPNIPVRQDTGSASKSTCIVSSCPSITCENKSLVDKLFILPNDAKLQIGIFNESNQDNVALGKVVTKLSILTKEKIDFKERKPISKISSDKSSMENFKNLPSDVENANSMTKKFVDGSTSSTYGTSPKSLTETSQSEPSPFEKNVNLRSIRNLTDAHPTMKAELNVLKVEASLQPYVESDKLQTEKEISKETIFTCSTAFSNLARHEDEMKTNVVPKILEISTLPLGDDSKPSSIKCDRLSTALDDLHVTDASKTVLHSQIEEFSCSLLTENSKQDNFTQVQLQLPCLFSDEIHGGKVPEVIDFKLTVEPNLEQENVTHGLLRSKQSNDNHSVQPAIPSVDKFDKGSSKVKQWPIILQKLGISEKISECQSNNLSLDTSISEVTSFHAKTSQTVQSVLGLCGKQNNKNMGDENSQTCIGQKQVGTSETFQYSSSNLDQKFYINKPEMIEQPCLKEMCYSEKSLKDSAKQKIEIPFIRSYQDNNVRKGYQKININKVENFKLKNTVNIEKNIQIDDKKKTMEVNINTEMNRCRLKCNYKKADMEISLKDHTEYKTSKQTEICASILPVEGRCLNELGSLLGLQEADESIEVPLLFDISSIPLPPVTIQDNEERTTTIIPIFKGSSCCDSNEGNFVADKMARKNKNSETLAAQKEANNGDVKQGEHSPKRKNTRARSKSTERDLVAVAEVEKRAGKLRRSSRGDKGALETVNKLDSNKNGTNNNQCLESITEGHENSVKEDVQLVDEPVNIYKSIHPASIENPADIPMPDIASVPLPEPKSVSVIETASKNPVVNSVNQSVLTQSDDQSKEKNVDIQDNKDEAESTKAVEGNATMETATEKKEMKITTSISGKRGSTEVAVSHSKRRGHYRSRSASSSSDRSSSKRKSSRRSRHSSSRRSPSSSSRYHRKSSRHSRHSSHKADGKSRSKSVENASSSKKRNERKDDKDLKKKVDKKLKEERAEKEFEDIKKKVSKESNETLDNTEIQDSSVKMSKEEKIDDFADKNAKDKKLKDRTCSSGDRDLKRDPSKMDGSSSNDSKMHSSRRDSTKNKDFVQEHICKQSEISSSDSKISEAPKNSNESSDSKNVARALSEYQETEKGVAVDDQLVEADTAKLEPDIIFKSARKVCLLRPKSIGEEEQEKPKKRKWGSTATSKSTYEISSNSLKTLIPDVKPLSPSEVTMKYSSESSEEEPEPEVEINLKIADHNDLMGDLMSDTEENYLEKNVEAKKEEKDDDSKADDDVQPKISPNKRKRSESIDARRKEKHERRESRRERIGKETQSRRHRKHTPEKADHPLVARKVSALEVGPYSYKPSIAPAQNPVSRVIVITNLTRPFTVKAITDLLLRTGRLAENGFWIDRIKSTCIAMFETEDQAEETRAALHGVKWPADNNKNLFVDFSTEDNLKEKLSDRDNSLPTYSAEEPRRDRRKFEGPIREWDLAKVGERSPGEREREKERQRREREEERERDKRRREQSPKEERKTKKPPPIKSVDDLFKKTKARPFIYWLPLTPEQIVEKEALRRKKMAESERMLAEMKEQERLRQKKREKERELREKEREQREKEREQREKERNAKRSRSRHRSKSRSQRKSPRRSPRRARRSVSRDSRKSHRRSRSRSRS